MGVDLDAAVVSRFEAKVDKRGPDECWLWRGATTGGDGYAKAVYGSVCVGKRRIGAHRIAYQLANGEIPEGMCVCHTCDNPLCCNPAHLWLGTIADNIRDRHRKGRSRGPGDRLSENLHIYHDSDNELTTKAVAEQLGVTIYRVRELAKMGLLNPRRQRDRNGRVLACYFARTEVEKYLRRRTLSRTRMSE